MLAILQKTVGPNFRAGDVIRGDNSRIKALSDKGLVTLDHSMMGMSGAIITIIFAALVIIAVIPLTFFIFSTKFNEFRGFSWFWGLTFIGVASAAISKNRKFFNNANNPYSAYYFSFLINFIPGIMIFAGHEKASAKYQNAQVSGGAAVSLFTTGAIATVFAVTGNIMWMSKFGDQFQFDSEGIVQLALWIGYVICLFIGSALAKYYDKDYQDRRGRYIAFLQKKNATIEYKTKALNAYRAYQKTGNADQFMIKNIELLEETLNVDRKQLEAQGNGKKK